MTEFLVHLFMNNNQDVENQAEREQYGKIAGIVGIAS